MSKIERIQQIKNIITKNSSVNVPTIVSELNISEPTARRYILELINTDKNYKKIRNGIGLSTKKHEIEYSFEEKLSVRLEQKKRIAQKATELVEYKQTIFIDSGTTCYFFAKSIRHKELQVVTSDLKIAYELSKYDNINLHVIGGEVRTGYYSIGGVLACENVKQIYVDTLVMSSDAFSEEFGITNFETFEVPIKQQLINSANTVMLLIDSSKISKRSFYKVADSTRIDVLITDSEIQKSQVKEIQDLGIKVIIS